MNVYRHTQPGHLLRAALLPMGIVAAIVTVLSQPAMPATLISGIAAASLLISVVLFHSLTVSVDSANVDVRFGPGLIHKEIPLAEIQDCYPVRNRWYYGWGIHLTPHGWLYNVSGFDAVEIQLRSGKKYRIGTDTPAELADAIRRAKT